MSEDKNVHRVVLEVNKGGYGKVTIDGLEIRARAVHICVHAGEATQVSIDLVACNVMVSADGETYALASMVKQDAERVMLPMLLPTAKGEH